MLQHCCGCGDNNKKWEWTKKKKPKTCDRTDGNVLWSGSQQLRATTPASWCWAVKAVYKDSAPPWGREKGGLNCASAHKWVAGTTVKSWKDESRTWEKPPRMMRCGGIPCSASCSIMALTGRRDNKVFHSISRIKCNTFISSPEIQKRRCVHCWYVLLNDKLDSKVTIKSELQHWIQCYT